jgi:hypothetical protein
MSRLNFLTQYAVNNRHYNSEKEVDSFIDKNVPIFDANRWSLEMELDANPHLFNEKHLRKIGNSIDHNGSFLIQHIIQHPDSPEDVHMKFANSGDLSTRALVAKYSKHEAPLMKLASDKGDYIKRMLLQNRNKPVSVEKHILDSPDWTLNDSSGNPTAYKQAVVMHTNNIETLEHGTNHPDHEVRKTAEMFSRFAREKREKNV